MQLFFGRGGGRGEGGRLGHLFAVVHMCYVLG